MHYDTTDIRPIPAALVSAAVAAPPMRWVLVGYCFWFGVFLGALLMRSVTTL